MRYEMKVTVWEGRDEFWEQNPTPEEVLEAVRDALFSHGFQEGWDTKIELTGTYLEPKRDPKNA